MDNRLNVGMGIPMACTGVVPLRLYTASFNSAQLAIVGRGYPTADIAQASLMEIRDHEEVARQFLQRGSRRTNLRIPSTSYEWDERTIHPSDDVIAQLFPWRLTDPNEF